MGNMAGLAHPAHHHAAMRATNHRDGCDEGLAQPVLHGGGERGDFTQTVTDKMCWLYA